MATAKFHRYHATSLFPRWALKHFDVAAVYDRRICSGNKMNAALIERRYNQPDE
jgi:hypothetical protein